MSIPLLITIIGTTYWTGGVVNREYVEWHDQRYPLRSEVIMLAQADRLEQQIARAQSTADDTGRKVDQVAHAVASLQVSAAISAVGALQSELDRHERSPEDSLSWQRERDRLSRQIQAATEYRDCLLEERPNCERLRGW